jgi:vacuolar-type H+-ATPase subunit I/STV1
MEKNFEFKKIDEDHYAFVMKSENIERTEVVKKQFAKDHYKEIAEQKKEYMRNLSKINHDLDLNTIVKDDEMEKFIEMANNAAKYQKFQKLETDKKAILEMIDGINKSMTNMEQTIPELKRMPE